MNYENYDLCFPDQPVVDLYLPIWANLPAFRNKPAFIWAEDGPARVSSSSTLTYEQLNTSVQSISSQILLSLQRGDTVVILCVPGLELVEIIFACQRAGLQAVPVTPPHPSFANDNHNHHLVRALSQTKPKAALATRSYIKRVREFTSSTSSASSNNRLSELLRPLTWIATDDLTGIKVDDVKLNSATYNGCRSNDVYLIQYTSGATGIPKPVLVTAGAAAHNVRVARKAYDLHPNSVIVSWLPQYHDCGLMFLLLTIVSGATCVLTSPNAFINRPRLWLELITEYKATCTPVPSFTLPLVIRRGGVDKGTSTINLESMKNLIIINEPIYKSSIEEFVHVFGLIPSSISPSYGLAENCTFVSTAWRSKNNGNFPIHKNLLPSAKLPCCREELMEEEIEILVVNEETHEPIDDGIEGEIWISSPSNASGYLGHPSLTRETFNGRLSNKRQGNCHRKTEVLIFTGRASDIIKRADGIEIHPHYVETSAYNSCREMLRAGCIAAFEYSGAIAVVAELQKGETDGMSLVKICEGIRNGVLNDEKVEVGEVILVKSGSVPKTTSGKIQRWAAKYKLETKEMNVVMKMEFGDINGCRSTLFKDHITHEKNGKEGKKKIEVNAEKRQGIFVATANTRNHLSLLSSL
ncbi:hypothetical protein DH2020_007605 [Rehmannia glutinosa]|uniref:AMP-dependent synthetase/ligase domain-containing protein n=1 Tax=Rehmannia glutinosa TaxID=99300 RepID=A0ABR0TZ50_REHGL